MELPTSSSEITDLPFSLEGKAILLLCQAPALGVNEASSFSTCMPHPETSCRLHVQIAQQDLFSLPATIRTCIRVSMTSVLCPLPLEKSEAPYMALHSHT